LITNRKQGLVEIMMLAPAMAILAVFLVSPFLISACLSLTNQRLIQGPVPTAFVALRNYRQIIGDPVFWRSLANVLGFALMVIPVQCGTALLLAVFLNKQVSFKGLIRGLYFLPYITPMVIVTVIWKTLYQYPSGVMNFLLGAIIGNSYKPIDWLGTQATAMPAIAILSAWQAYSFQMVIYLGGLQTIPNEIYEAATIDGASRSQAFRYITWPSLANTNVLVLIITTIQALKLYTQIDILTQGGPGGATTTPIYYIVNYGFRGQKIGYSSAASVLFFLIILTVVVVQKILTRNLDKQAKAS
jgi:multiple sugar transport system permease protein